MSIEELLGMSANQLEALTDAQLRTYFAPYLMFIQPEKREENGQKKFSLDNPQRRVPSNNAFRNADKAMETARRLAKQLGVEI